MEFNGRNGRIQVGFIKSKDIWRSSQEKGFAEVGTDILPKERLRDSSILLAGLLLFLFVGISMRCFQRRGKKTTIVTICHVIQTIMHVAESIA